MVVSWNRITLGGFSYMNLFCCLLKQHKLLTSKISLIKEFHNVFTSSACVWFGSPFFSVIRLCLLLVLEETVNKHPLFAVSELLPLCRDASAISDVFPGAYEHKEYQESP